jgi:hypothetical protein
MAPGPKELKLNIIEQPDDETCGPACLASVYQFHKSTLSIDKVVKEVDMFEEGGTIAANLGRHALSAGFETELYSFNLTVFDPSWFELSTKDLIKKLLLQVKKKPHNTKLLKATDAYIDYLKKGGILKFDDITPQLIRSFIDRGLPMVVGLSSTFLYRSIRENPLTTDFDDVGGEPTGHFVVVNGYDPDRRTVRIADPFKPNPLAEGHYYETNMIHLISAIFMGVVTYDANLLVVKPKGFEA